MQAQINIRTSRYYLGLNAVSTKHGLCTFAGPGFQVMLMMRLPSATCHLVCCVGAPFTFVTVRIVHCMSAGGFQLACRHASRLFTCKMNPIDRVACCCPGSASAAKLAWESAA